jgi:hypothetical protein
MASRKLSGDIPDIVSMRYLRIECPLENVRMQNNTSPVSPFIEPNVIKIDDCDCIALLL